VPRGVFCVRQAPINYSLLVHTHRGCERARRTGATPSDTDTASDYDTIPRWRGTGTTPNDMNTASDTNTTFRSRSTCTAPSETDISMAMKYSVGNQPAPSRCRFFP
jgi:hypothetical protein